MEYVHKLLASLLNGTPLEEEPPRVLPPHLFTSCKSEQDFKLPASSKEWKDRESLDLEIKSILQGEREPVTTTAAVTGRAGRRSPGNRYAAEHGSRRATGESPPKKRAVAASGGGYARAAAGGSGASGVYSSRGESCAKCKTLDTPQWRYIHTQRFCNACYMRVKRWADAKFRGERRLPARARNDISPDDHQKLLQETQRIIEEAFRALDGPAATPLTPSRSSTAGRRGHSPLTPSDLEEEDTSASSAS